MTERQKNEIIESGKEYFRTIIIPNHLNNLNKLRLSSFNINPFLVNYLAAFLCGDTSRSRWQRLSFIRGYSARA